MRIGIVSETYPPEINGVALTVPPMQGHDAAYVQRLLTCQAAQARASSNAATTSPLAVDGSTTSVVDRQGMYEIQLTNPDPTRAREIQRRVDAMRAMPR